MSIEDLRQRYLWIAKNSLDFLKEQGFKKKGKKYIKQKGDLMLEIAPEVPRAWLNSDDSYEFEISWAVLSLDPELVQLYSFMEGDQKAFLIWSIVMPDHLEGKARTLGDKDSSDFDQKYIEGIKEKLKTIVLPLFDRLNSLDDVIHLAEKEAKLERNKREFFSRTNIYRDLTYFYGAKGWKEKALEMCDKYVQTTPEPAQELAEKNKKKYVEYFEKFKKG